MKKSVLLFALLSSTLISLAQEGEFMVGGALGFGRTEFDNQKATVWEISPDIGYWITDDIQLGVSASYQDFSGDEGSILTNESFSTGVYGRKWFNQDEKLSFLLGANFNYIHGIGENESGYEAFIDAGIGYRLSNRIMLIGRYSVLGIRDYGRSKTYGLEFDTRQNPFNLGVYFLLGK